MIVFPLKWLPALLAVGGVFWIAEEGAGFLPIVVTAIGCIWSYYSYFKKD